MDFKEFSNMLHPVIGMGSNTSTFVKTLFDSIITDEGKDILVDYTESSFKAYFNGNQKITKLAQKISGYIEPEDFATYIEQLTDAVTDSLCDSFRFVFPDIDSYNAGEKLAKLFAAIIKEAASTKKKGTPKDASNKSTATSDSINDVIAAIADERSSAVKQLLDDDKRLLEKFKLDSDYVLRYIIEHDPSGEATSIIIADKIATIYRTWQFDLRKIKDTNLRNLVVDTLKTLDEYTYYISDKFLRVIPDSGVLWFRNESLEEGEQLREVLRPQTIRLRKKIAVLYKSLFPIPEDSTPDDEETIESEIVDDNEPSGATNEDEKKTVIQHQTNVVQNGENNFNLTNNGTMNFNL